MKGCVLVSYSLVYTSEEMAFLVPLSPVVRNWKQYVNCSDHLMLSSHVAASSWRSFVRETQVSWDNLLFESNSSLVEKKNKKKTGCGAREMCCVGNPLGGADA